MLSGYEYIELPPSRPIKTTEENTQEHMYNSINALEILSGNTAPLTNEHIPAVLSAIPIVSHQIKLALDTPQLSIGSCVGMIFDMGTVIERCWRGRGGIFQLWADLRYLVPGMISLSVFCFDESKAFVLAQLMDDVIDPRVITVPKRDNGESVMDYLNTAFPYMEFSNRFLDLTGFNVPQGYLDILSEHTVWSGFDNIHWAIMPSALTWIFDDADIEGFKWSIDDITQYEVADTRLVYPDDPVEWVVEDMLPLIEDSTKSIIDDTSINQF